MEESKYGVHRTHCCLMHGCKYGDEDCPVVNKIVVQEYVCEQCSESGIKSVTEMTRQQKLEKPGQVKIEIGVEPDEEMAKQGTPYSWCVMRYTEPTGWDYSRWAVVASGWSASHQQGYLDASEALKPAEDKV